MYATLQDLIDRVGLDVLSDLARGEIDSQAQNEPYTRVVDAIRSATNLVDSYVQSRYPVPLNPVPEVIRDKAIDIALYYLASWRGLNPEEQGQLLVTNYKAAERWLGDVATGKVSLGPAPAPPQPSGMQISASPRIFSRDKLRGW
ncbi:MAG: gp436 family protein [Bacillota bacterium]